MASQDIATPLAQETWKPIPGYVGAYEVSDLGLVRSVTRLVPHSTSGSLLLPGKLLSTGALRNGYPTATLCVNHQRKSFKVHRLVLLAFVGECPAGMESCHKDGNKKNNALSNLRYDTRKLNNADKILHGTDNNGDKNHRAILTPEQVSEIRRRAKGGESGARIAIEFGVARRTISGICSETSWRTIDRSAGNTASERGAT